MLPFDADPVIAEALELRDEMRLVRIALRSAEAQQRAGHLASLDRLGAELNDILDDKHHRELLEAALDERARTLRIAALARREELAERSRTEQASALVASAAGASRRLTADERARVRSLRLTAGQAGAGVSGCGSSPSRMRSTSLGW